MIFSFKSIFSWDYNTFLFNSLTYLTTLFFKEYVKSFECDVCQFTKHVTYPLSKLDLHQTLVRVSSCISKCFNLDLQFFWKWQLCLAVKAFNLGKKIWKIQREFLTQILFSLNLKILLSSLLLHFFAAHNTFFSPLNHTFFSSPISFFHLLSLPLYWICSSFVDVLRWCIGA